MVDTLLPREQIVIEQKSATIARPQPIYLEHIRDVNDLDLDEFERAMPSKEALEFFRDAKGNLTPHLYWEMIAPGSELKFYPRTPSITSSADGLWRARNPYEEELVRRHLGEMADQLRVDMDEYRRAMRDADQWLQCQNCPVRTTSVFAIKLHTRHWKHTMA